MTRLPVVDARTLERVLLRQGFAAVRQKGSHVFYRHPDGRNIGKRLPVRQVAQPRRSFG